MSEIVIPANFTPRDYQVPFMRHFDAGGTRAAWCVHRRGGKDRTALAQVSKMALRRKGAYWHMLPTLKQARKVVWDNITGDGLKLIDATFPREIVKGRREDDMKIELINGSIVQLLGADNVDANVGANPVHVTFSEYAITNPRAWNLIRPIVTENNGTAAFISTPRGYNHFHDMMEVAKSDPTGKWYHAIMGIDYTREHGGTIPLSVLEDEVREGMPPELVRQEYLCDFSAANVGAILGRWMEEAEKSGRIDDRFTFDPAGAPLELSSDIGFSDSTVWWVWQRTPNGYYRVLACIPGNGKDADDWIEALIELGYGPERVGQMWLPHDARAKTFATKTSPLERFRAAGYRAQIVPQVSVSHRINAARMVARRCGFNRSGCAEGLNALRSWQFKYDEITRTFSSEPLHDWASHFGDGFSYGALVMNPRAMGPAVEAEPEKKYAVPVHHSFNLDQLWANCAPTVARRH